MAVAELSEDLPTSILALNVGSSSVKLAFYGFARGTLHKRASCSLATSVDGLRESLSSFIKENSLTVPDIVAHRFVHGGSKYTSTKVLDDVLRRDLDEIVELAPLHLPPSLTALDISKKLFGKEVRHVAVFDTAFFATLPQVARTYAIPQELTKKYGLYRFGFHGLAHQFMLERYAERSGAEFTEKRILSLQLGGGCSITASVAGRPVDTSMGFTPLEGLIMATRSGDVDPGLLLYLQRKEELSVDAFERILNTKSGLFALSGGVSDYEKLLSTSTEEADFARQSFMYRLKKYVGAYLGILGGVDAVLFGGGIGENVSEVRQAVFEALSAVGGELDDKANQSRESGDKVISSAASRIEAVVIEVDEQRKLAKEAVSLFYKEG